MNYWLLFWKPPVSRVDVFFEWTADDFRRCKALFDLGYVIKERIQDD